MSDQLVWIDCEMTGLNLTTDALVEIACIVTDSELKPVDEGIDVLIKPPAEALDIMLEVVREMHTNSGRSRLRAPACARVPQGAAVRQLDSH